MHAELATVGSQVYVAREAEAGLGGAHKGGARSQDELGFRDRYQVVPG